MNHPADFSADTPTPPPPRPGPTESGTAPDMPTPAQLRAAAACLTALVYHNPPPHTPGNGWIGERDTLWHLSSYTKTACTRTGLPHTVAIRTDILRITVYALGAVAAVRPAELVHYLQAITPDQQRALFSLAHQRLAGQRTTEHASTEPAPEDQEGA